MKHSVYRYSLPAFFLCAVLAWAQPPDLNQLKSKLQQLEQMMQDLKQQIAEAEGARAEWVDRTPMHRYGSPDELAGAAVFLCSDAASFITGQVLAVDGGFLAAGLTVPDGDHSETTPEQTSTLDRGAREEIYH